MIILEEGVLMNKLEPKKISKRTGNTLFKGETQLMKQNRLLLEKIRAHKEQGLMGFIKRLF